MTITQAARWLVARGGTEHLHDATVTGVRAHGPLAAALLEIAGNVLLLRDTIRQWVAEGRINLRALITHRLPLADVARGLELCRSRPDATIKVVLDIPS